MCCGSGGVGKTTTAAALAAMAATRHGGRVLVLTVDPARRLANALGLEGFGNVEKRVPDSAFEAANVKPRGELWAAMLDTRQSWDDLVHRHAPDRATEQRILENKLYQNFAGRFVQSHDYIAMERLYEIHSSGTYDLVVVDTPPTRNAVDFLDAPERMEDFFTSRFLRLLIAPYRSRLISMASKPFYQSPTASSAPSSCRTSPSSSFSSRACTAVSSTGPAPCRGVVARQAQHVRGGVYARSGAVARSRVLPRRSWNSASCTSGAIVLNKVLPAYFLEAVVGPYRRARHRRR